MTGNRRFRRRGQGLASTLVVASAMVVLAACASTSKGQPVGSLSTPSRVIPTASPIALEPNELPDLTGLTKQQAVAELHRDDFRNVVFIPAGSLSDGMRVKDTDPSPLDIVKSKAARVTLILVP